MSKSKRTIINTLSLGVFIVAGIFNVSYGQAKVDKPDKLTSAYVIDKKESVVTWKCSMVFADKGGHTGYVSISKGELMIEKGQLVGGAVEVDMNTVADEQHGSDNNLIEHLKSADFFEVKKFPTSAFAITKVAAARSEERRVGKECRARR